MHYIHAHHFLDLNDFTRRLDIRYSKKVSTEGGTVARKMRKLGEPSKSFPPSDAPDWTVDPSKLSERYNNVSLEADSHEGKRA